MKNIFKCLAVFIIIFIMLAYSNISMANKINDLKDEQSDVKQNITATQKKIDQVSKEKEETFQEINRDYDKKKKLMVIVCVAICIFIFLLIFLIALLS